MPQDGQRFLPAHKPEQPGLSQQLQAGDLRRLRVKFQIIGFAQADTVLQLDDLLDAQIPERHPLTSLFPPYAAGAEFMQKEWKKLGQLCYTRPGITPKMQTRFEETGMYKNIIFDFGGVMVDFDPKEYLVDRFCNAETEELVSQLTFESEEWKLLDAGLLSRYEANQRMLTRAKEHDCVFEVQGVLDDWMHILRPRRKMQELVQKLKAHGYCVYYLSNIPEDVLALLMERDFQGLFDGGVASCEVHVNKPDPRIYQALLDKYGLKASESVFIDDRQDNVQAAFELGFVGIRMKDSVGTLVRSLATCNVVVR